MTAYAVLEYEVTDHSSYGTYHPKAQQLAKKYGARILADGGTNVTLEGHAPKRIVILEFDSAEAAQKWYRSPEYSEHKQGRMKAAQSHRIFVVDGHKG